jgi:glutaredoxin
MPCRLSDSVHGPLLCRVEIRRTTPAVLYGRAACCQDEPTVRSFSGGRNTVPQIFFNSEHLGGSDDVHKLDADGKLAEKLEYDII